MYNVNWGSQASEYQGPYPGYGFSSQGYQVPQNWYQDPRPGGKGPYQITSGVLQMETPNHMVLNATGATVHKVPQHGTQDVVLNISSNIDVTATNGANWDNAVVDVLERLHMIHVNHDD